MFLRSETGCALLVIAIAAVYRTISAGLERNLGGLSAAIADHIVHNALSIAVLAIGSTAGSTASRAAAGLILEALVSIELLFGSGENELVAALTAGQSLVLIHGIIPSSNVAPFLVHERLKPSCVW